jgi:ppGpp synthetase/RelA/SpoT-type nucleotidyltranferase
MTTQQTDGQTGWLQALIRDYNDQRPSYETLQEVLIELIEHLTQGLPSTPMIKARTKDPKSFADKCLRYEAQGIKPDSLHDVFDICAARVVLTLKPYVNDLTKALEKHLLVDAAKSQDTSIRLDDSAFGYLSHHLIVQVQPLRLKPWMVEQSLWEELGGTAEKWKKSPAPQGEHCIVTQARWKKIKGLTAEIQVRTIAEHSWSEISHLLDYKQGAFMMPAEYKRRLARVAAEIEHIDENFENLARDVQQLRSNAGTYLHPEESEEVARRLRDLLDSGAGDESTAAELARIRISLGEYEQAIQVIESRYSDHPRGMKWLGRAHCMIGKRDNDDQDFTKGRDYLQRSYQIDDSDLETLTFLAESYLTRDLGHAHKLFLHAAKSDASDPAILSGLLRSQQDIERSEQMLSTLSGALDTAIDRCEERIKIRENLPDALYQLAEFLLLRQATESDEIQSLLRGEAAPKTKPDLSMAYKGLGLLCRGMTLVRSHGWRLLQTHAGYDAKQKLEAKRPWLKWARQAVLLRLVVKGHKNKLGTADLPTTDAVTQKIYDRDGRVLIVAGGCDTSSTQQIETFAPCIEQALASFEGTVISGGTSEGISGLVGRICRNTEVVKSGQIKTVGYLPKVYDTTTATPSDALYDVLFQTDSEVGFSAAEPIQAWIDMLASGVKPENVTLIGINGGNVASFEYQFAAAMGARVVLITGSGRAVDDCWTHRAEPGVRGKLLFLPADLECVREIIEAKAPDQFEDQELEKMVTTISRTYNKALDKITRERRKEQAKQNPKMRKEFDDSNRQQALHILKKIQRLEELTSNKYELAPIDDPRDDQSKLFHKYSEKFSEIEHARWVVERAIKGWQLGPRSNKNKTRPTMISWDEMQSMPEEILKDHMVVKAIPSLLSLLGYKVVRAQEG